MVFHVFSEFRLQTEWFVEHSNAVHNQRRSFSWKGYMSVCFQGDGKRKEWELIIRYKMSASSRHIDHNISRGRLALHTIQPLTLEILHICIEQAGWFINIYIGLESWLLEWTVWPSRMDNISSEILTRRNHFSDMLHLQYPLLQVTFSLTGVFHHRDDATLHPHTLSPRSLFSYFKIKPNPLITASRETFKATPWLTQCPVFIMLFFILHPFFLSVSCQHQWSNCEFLRLERWSLMHRFCDKPLTNKYHVFNSIHDILREWQYCSVHVLISFLLCDFNRQQC